MINGLTVDLEDWYHICGVDAYSDPKQWDSYESRILKNTDKILSLFRTYGIKATFLCWGILPTKSKTLSKPFRRKAMK